MINQFPYYLLSFLVSFILITNVSAQTILDSTGKRIEVSPSQQRVIDSVVRNHSPRKAAIRSAILPGLGQAYNKKYWKIPIVYGALCTAGGIFMYNRNWYNRFRFAYTTLVNRDTANFTRVHPQLQAAVNRNDQSYLRVNRDEFRRNIDYSILAFIVLWGLNIVDASVDAHLRTFDVSPDLSFRFRAGYSDMAKTNGVSLVLAFK